jgi:hypothetical protein
MKQVHLTLKTAVQNRRENRDRMKIEEKTIVRQISAFKASVIKRLDELEKSNGGLLTCSFDSKLHHVGYKKSP